MLPAASTVMILAVGSAIRSVDFADSNGVLITYGNGSYDTIPMPIANATPTASYTDRGAKRDNNCSPSRMVGYYNSWVLSSERQTDLIRVLSEYYTDVIYSFFPVTDIGVVSYLTPMLGDARSSLDNIMSLRNRSRVERVLYNIGNWIYYADAIDTMYPYENDTAVWKNAKSFNDIWDLILNDVSVRSIFMTSARRMMERHNFDGIDIEFSYYPTERRTYSEVRRKFINLLQMLRNSLPPGKVLSLGPAASNFVLSRADGGSSIKGTVDHFNVMPRYDKSKAHGTVHVQSKLYVMRELLGYLQNGYDPQLINLVVSATGRGYIVPDLEFFEVEQQSNLSGMTVLGLSRPTAQLSSPGAVSYAELFDEFPDTRKYRIPNDGSWLLDASENILVSYIDVPDAKELRSIYSLLGLGGMAIQAVELDDNEPKSDRQLVKALYKC